MEVMDMPSVSNMAKDLVGSEIIRLAAQINDKIKNGQSIYNLTIGDFNPEIVSGNKILCTKDLQN